MFLGLPGWIASFFLDLLRWIEGKGCSRIDMFLGLPG